MNGELLSILSTIERDKGIDREVLIQAIENAVATAAKKSEGVSDEAEATVTLDRKTGRMTVLVEGRPVDSAHLTRIAAQTAKQVIIQKIREAERDVIFTEFQGRVGDIVTGSVHRFERGDIIVELGRAEAVLPKAERIPHEEYRQGDMIQGYVVEVRKSVKGPAIVLSRTHEGFIRGLFTLEVPEISEGIVAIKGIAREAGDRTKIAVFSTDEKVDCVGACVGMRGTRVKNIVRELHGEKIDIVRWQESAQEFIAAALSPARIAQIHAEGESKQALVIVEDDQLSLAIGKRGQNVRLASKLTGWQLEIKSQSQEKSGELSLRKLPGVGPAMEKRLTDAGVASVQQLAAMTLDQLRAIEGVGEKTAQKLLESAKELSASSAQPLSSPSEAGSSVPSAEAKEEAAALASEEASSSVMEEQGQEDGSSALAAEAKEESPADDEEAGEEPSGEESGAVELSSGAEDPLKEDSAEEVLEDPSEEPTEDPEKKG